MFVKIVLMKSPGNFLVAGFCERGCHSTSSQLFRLNLKLIFIFHMYIVCSLIKQRE